VTCIRFKPATGRRKGILCYDVNILEVDNPDCPNVANHEPWPAGYIQSSDYADKMMETHDQSECPGCGRLLIWTLKETT
jgi:hypothetical protein